MANAIFELLAGLVEFAAGLLPDVDIDFPADLNLFFKWMRHLNGLLPISEMLICLSVFIAIAVAMWSFKWFIKLIDWLPFKFS